MMCLTSLYYRGSVECKIIRIMFVRLQTLVAPTNAQFYVYYIFYYKFSPTCFGAIAILGELTPALLKMCKFYY
jgi:hypothetical protein